MADLTPESLRAVMRQQREDAEREPRPDRRRPVSDDVAYAHRLEDNWARNHPVRTGYRGRAVTPPAELTPDELRNVASVLVPDGWRRPEQAAQEWPENADPQAKPAERPPWERKPA